MPPYIIQFFIDLHLFLKYKIKKNYYFKPAVIYTGGANIYRGVIVFFLGVTNLEVAFEAI